MKDLKPIKGAYYIRRLIEEGEHEQQDFKFAVSDARKIARSVSAFANNRGGHLLIGVRDNGSIAGIRSEEDIFVVEQAAEIYCTPPQSVEAQAFLAEGGAVVVRMTIASTSERPVRVIEADGSRRAYFRVADENIAVPHFVARAWESEPIPGLISLSGPERALLDHLEGDATLSFDDAMRLIHLTSDDTERTVAHLYRLELISFVHRPGGFRIALRTDKKD